MPARRRSGKHGAARGFTLLEVLVALALTAVGLAALWNVLNQGVVISGALPDRVVARWVAHNRVVLRQAGSQWPEPQVYRGAEEMAGRTWHWEEEIATTSEPRLRRITVRVGASPEALTLATLDGFIRQPHPPR